MAFDESRKISKLLDVIRKHLMEHVSLKLEQKYIQESQWGLNGQKYLTYFNRNVSMKGQFLKLNSWGASLKKSLLNKLGKVVPKIEINGTCNFWICNKIGWSIHEKNSITSIFAAFSIRDHSNLWVFLQLFKYGPTLIFCT